MIFGAYIFWSFQSNSVITVWIWINWLWCVWAAAKCSYINRRLICGTALNSKSRVRCISSTAQKQQHVPFRIHCLLDSHKPREAASLRAFPKSTKSIPDNSEAGRNKETNTKKKEKLKVDDVLKGKLSHKHQDFLAALHKNKSENVHIYSVWHKLSDQKYVDSRRHNIL